LGRTAKGLEGGDTVTLGEAFGRFAAEGTNHPASEWQRYVTSSVTCLAVGPAAGDRDGARHSATEAE
jgi:hypothetical protein